MMTEALALDLAEGQVEIQTEETDIFLGNHILSSACATYPNSDQYVEGGFWHQDDLGFLQGNTPLLN